MAKIRIHEIAKELNIQAKDVMGFLETNKIEAKSHMSTLEESSERLVRERFGKKVDVAPKKKSSITAVYHPQNSNHPAQKTQQRKIQGDRPAVQENTGEALGNGGQMQVTTNTSNTAEKIIQPENTEKATEPKTGSNIYTNRPQGDRPQGDRPRYNNDRPQGDRPRYNNDRPQGDRPRYNNDRPQGDRPQGDRPRYNNGPQGDRPRYNNNGPQGDRPRYNNNGPQGDRPRYNNNGPQGDRPRYNNNGPQGDRPRYNNNGPQGGNRNYAGNKLDKDIDKFNKSTTPVEDTRPKDRENKRLKAKPGADKKTYNDKPKRQERIVNLEKSTVKKKTQYQQKPVEDKDTIKNIILPEFLTIRELADKMKLQPSDIVKKLFLQGKVVTVNQEIGFETAEEIALEFNYIAEQEVKVDVIAELLKEEDEDADLLKSRPPVVCVMGHVDHGKTSLLDAIRNSHVTDRESGGITQHIGAYVVSSNGQKITFLDTPGHEAFTAMRMRGANATDIAILVVAADDGVMPQTVEAINHAKAAGIEIIVAVNKIDKPSANIDKVKQELSEYELIPEDWGGTTIFVPVSAHTHEGIDQLLEMVLLTAEVGELKANPNRKARGLVIEAKLDKGRGVVATILVQKGTLAVGQPVAAGSCYGKVRAMTDDNGRRVKSAGPSTPVEIIGLNAAPNAGDVFVCTENDKDARIFAETFITENKERLLDDTKAKLSLDDLFSKIKAGNLKELDIIVKADVQGSVEAVKQSLVKLSNEEVIVKVIHGGVGAITESDVNLASASNAIIIGFNVRPDAAAKMSADKQGVDLRLYKVIYNAIEDVEAAMKGMLDPVFEEKILGHAEIRQIFKASGIGNIAGSYILDGLFQRGCSVRVTREGESVFEGKLASLKRFKDDVKEVKAGYECGLVFDGFSEIKEFDQVEAYTMVEVPR